MKIVASRTAADTRPVQNAWLEQTRGIRFGLSIDLDTAEMTLQSLINAGAVLFLAVDRDKTVGFISVSVVPSLIGPQSLAHCTFWYALPGSGAGPKLLQAAKDWARETDCSHLTLNASKLASDSYGSICKYCAKMGAKEFETSFILETF